MAGYNKQAHEQKTQVRKSVYNNTWQARDHQACSAISLNHLAHAGGTHGNDLPQPPVYVDCIVLISIAINHQLITTDCCFALWWCARSP